MGLSSHVPSPLRWKARMGGVSYTEPHPQAHFRQSVAGLKLLCHNDSILPTSTTLLMGYLLEYPFYLLESSRMSPENPYLEKLRQMVLEHLKGYHIEVYLIGSRAKGTAGRISDVDLALLPLEDLPDDLIPNFREFLEESHTPYKVDVVDLSEVDKETRDRMLIGAVRWRG